MNITLKRNNPPLTEESKQEWITWAKGAAEDIASNKNDIDDSDDSNRIFGTERNDSDEILAVLITMVSTLEQNTITPKN